MRASRVGREKKTDDGGIARRELRRRGEGRAHLVFCWIGVDGGRAVSGVRMWNADLRGTDYSFDEEPNQSLEGVGPKFRGCRTRCKIPRTHTGTAFLTICPRKGKGVGFFLFFFSKYRPFFVRKGAEIFGAKARKADVEKSRKGPHIKRVLTPLVALWRREKKNGEKKRFPLFLFAPPPPRDGTTKSGR